MTKFRPTCGYLVVGVALILGWFYWAEWRPEKIRQECATLLTEIAQKSGQYGGIRTLQNMCEDAGGVSNFLDAAEKGMAQNSLPDEALPAENVVE